MEEDHQYGNMADLRQYMNSARPNLFPQPPDLLSGHRGLPGPNPYEMLMFRSDSTSTGHTSAVGVGGGGGTSSGGVPGCSLSGGFDNGLIGGGDGGTGRWPRQETLTLLEIRSRLDSKFKEANQKGPLWDEVSRIMSEEHGYQRSGKKCREKFENLYKYYKKTKEGKAGRQDGKHYRFFRQLEALYGDHTSTTNNSAASVSEAHLLCGNFHYNYPNHSPSLAYNQEAFQGTKLSDTSLSLSNYSDSDTSNSSDNSDDPNDQGMDDVSDQKKKKKKGKRDWKAKIKDFIDFQMKKLMDKQEAWMERMVKTIEQKEHERMLREEEWRKQDALRVEREHKFWASERAWIEARDAAIMDALHKFTGKELTVSTPDELMGAHHDHQNDQRGDHIWPECEINRLIQLRSGMEVKFNQSHGISEEMLWDEISRKMACFGHERSGIMCKEKWDGVNNYLLKCNKKRKDQMMIASKSGTFYQNHDPSTIGGAAYCHEQQGHVDHHTIMRLSDHGNSSSSPSSSNNHNNNNPGNNNITENCFRYFMGDPYGRIMD